MKKEKLYNLESLRGIAALVVAIHHFNIGSNFNNSFTKNGWLMVDFFFVLSGFVITYNYLDRISSLSNLFEFQKKRFLRLYPLHLLMLIIFFIIEISKFIVEIKFNLIAGNQAFSINNFNALISNILLIHNFIINEPTFNHPSWSISAEFFTYGIYGLIILIVKNNIKLILIVLVTNLFLLSFIFDNFFIYSFNISGPLRCLYSFSIGSILFIFYRYFKNKYYLSTSLISILLIFFNILIIIFFENIDYINTKIIPFSFGCIIFSLLITNKNAIINKILINKYLIYLGTISYGIYMIHYALWWLIRQILRFIFEIPILIDSNNQITISINNLYLANFITCVGIFILIILAHFSHKFFELKFYNKS